LYRGFNIGETEGLSITAKESGCTVEVPSAFIEAPVEWRQFLFVPLVPERSLVEELRFNDIDGLFIEFPLRKMGTYELSARLHVDRTDERHTPSWNGVVEAAPRSMLVRSAAPAAVARWLGVLERCAAGDCRDIESATKFFSVVRDDRAAALLAGLANKGGGVMHAIAAQGRAADVPVLRAYAMAQTVPATRVYYMEAAARIERDDPCK
jgi:hypothetical protein